MHYISDYIYISDYMLASTYLKSDHINPNLIKLVFEILFLSALGN